MNDLAGPRRGGVILDFDNTMLVDPAFYAEIYGPALDETVAETRGEAGLAMLRWHRDQTGHMGVLTLPFFGIDFARFAEKLCRCPIDGLAVPPRLAGQLGRLVLPKIIYSGSPDAFIRRVLHHWRLDETMFAEIIAWHPGEDLPLKHCASPRVFQAINDRHGWAPHLSWSIGDSSASDLVPARWIGMRTIAIGPDPGHADLAFATLEQALDHLAARPEIGLRPVAAN